MLPPKPLKISCPSCGYKAIWNPNSDVLSTPMPEVYRCKRCFSTCSISPAKSIRAQQTWLVLEKPPFDSIG